MEFKTKKVKGKGLQFYEEGRLIHEGRTFASGGAYIGQHKKTGKLGGLFYAYPEEGKIGDWSGKNKYPAHFGNEWNSSFGDKRQHVEFNIGNKKFSGTYFKSGSDIVRFKEVGKLKKVV